MNTQPLEGKRRLIYIDDGVPPLGTQFLMRSCHQRGCDFVTVNPHKFDFSMPSPLVPGDLMYRPAISFVAQRLEQHLYVPGVATFHGEEDEIYFACTNPVSLFEHHRLSIPRTIFCQTTDRTLLGGYAQRLGGFPLIYKITGFSTGVGVGRLDSPAALYSFVDFALALGRYPLLMPFIDGAVHWRMVVVGEQVVASYRNLVAENDFRTFATRDTSDYSAHPSAALQQLAIRSSRALRLEFGGVDVLEHPSGRGYLLETNFPCYFAQAQDVAGVDISGAMVDHLIAKSGRLTAALQT